jgi:hypothetical protein
LLHYNRKDLWFKIAGLIANAVHWYNPAVCILNRQLNTFCELSCDEKIASDMGAAGRRFYGETILQVLQHSTTHQSFAGNLMLATNLCNSKKDIKRRLINMMKVKKMNKTAAALALTAGMLIVAGGFVISHLVDFSVPVSAASESANMITDAFVELPEETIAVLPNETVVQSDKAADEHIDVPALAPIPIYHNGEFGFEAHPDADTVTVRAVPLIFNDSIELLESIHEEMGNIMWPTYLPEGFAISGIGILNPQSYLSQPELFTEDCYKHLNTLSVSFTDGEAVIRLWINYYQSYFPPSDPYSLELYPNEPHLMEHQQLAEINGFKAAVSTPTPPYWLSPTVFLWDTDNGLEDHFANPDITAFLYSGTVYQFCAYEESDVTEEVLTEMAESLVHIQDLLD